MNRLLVYFIFGTALMAVSCAQKSRNAGSMNNQLRVMAYNIHHCNPPSKPGLSDLDAVAAAIKAQNPDLVALQEVDVNTARSGKNNQAREIAKKLGMKYFFAKAIDHEGGDYGVAILSKYPLSETKINRLPTEASTKGEPRILATAKIRLPGGKLIRFGSTHLDAQKGPVNREMQIAEINRLAGEETLPFIIAGDFNATAGSTVINLLDEEFKRTCSNCDPTIPVITPTKTIDFIAFRPGTAFKAISTRVIPERYASDHLPVMAVVEY